MKNNLFIKFTHIGSFILLTLLFISCAEKYSESQLYGNWKVSQWKIESSGKLVPNKMDMEFNADGKYSIDYGRKKESGKYWIAQEYLHTAGKGLTEKSVKILNITTDSLIIQMNRAGEMENVILLRK